MNTNEQNTLEINYEVETNEVEHSLADDSVQLALDSLTEIDQVSDLDKNKLTKEQKAYRLAMKYLTSQVIYAEENPSAWAALILAEKKVRQALGDLGLTLILNKSDNFAYLTEPGAEEDSEDSKELRFINQRALSLWQSVLLALARKRLAEFEASEEGTRLIMTTQEFFDLTASLRESGLNSNQEIEQIKSLDLKLKKLCQLGFLKSLDSNKSKKIKENRYEIRRIIKAFIDGKWLADELESKLKQYLESSAKSNAVKDLEAALEADSAEVSEDLSDES